MPGGPSSRARTRSALALMTLLFFMWGFITVLNDILIPHLKGLFELSNFEVGFGKLRPDLAGARLALGLVSASKRHTRPLLGELFSCDSANA